MFKYVHDGCLLFLLHLTANDHPHISFTAIECILENKKKKLIKETEFLFITQEIFIIIFWLQCCDNNLYQRSCVLGVRVLDLLAKEWFRPLGSSADFSTYLHFPSCLTNSDPYHKLTQILFLLLHDRYLLPATIIFNIILSHEENGKSHPLEILTENMVLTRWFFTVRRIFGREVEMPRGIRTA